MTLLQRLIEKPRTFAARGWIFQVHLYCGLGVAFYALVIGITGSALVFAPEMRDWQNRAVLRVEESGVRVPVEAVMESAHRAYPNDRATLVYLPTEERGTFRVSIGESDNRRTIYVHPFTAEIVGERAPRRDLLGWLENLHFDLLGGRTGRIVNGVFALLTLLLCATGIVIWWPGKAHWKRAMSINWQARWKRANYDVHSAGGFFALLFIVLLSLTGAYFAWPKLARDLVSWFSPVTSGSPAPVLPLRDGLTDLPLTRLLEAATHTVPDSWLELVIFPAQEGQAVRIYLMSGGPRDYQTTSTVDVDPKTGAVLQSYTAQGRSAGDAVMAWLAPLHFGSFGGVPVKILWVVLGLSPAVLGVSGALMWWNRVAVKEFSRRRRMRTRDAASASSAPEVTEEVCS